MKRNNLKTLLTGYRATLADPTVDLAFSVVSIKVVLDDAVAELSSNSATRHDAHRVCKTLDAVIADMRAEDAATAKKTEQSTEPAA